jgi:hypothetical protein
MPIANTNNAAVSVVAIEGAFKSAVIAGNPRHLTAINGADSSYSILLLPGK